MVVSKPVRLADYLYAQVEELAAAEKRSLANMVQVLLEQALKLQGGYPDLARSLTERAAGPPERALGNKVVARAVSDRNPDVKTDFK